MHSDHEPIAAPAPRKILFVIGSLDIGGAESQMLMLIGGLLARGVVCEVAPLEARGPLRTRLDEMGVRVHDGGYDRTRPVAVKIMLLLRAFLRLRRTAARFQPDVLQAYLPLTNFFGALAGRLAGVKTVITCRRGLGKHQDRHPFWPIFDRLANAMSTVVTVNSLAVARDVEARDRIDSSKLVLIPNGLDFEAFDRCVARGAATREALGLMPGEIGCLSVGNLIPYKGYGDLVDAIALLPASLSHLRFFITGEDRGHQAALEAQIRDRQIAPGRVVFLGRRRDVPRLMSLMDMFVMPSHEEGFSNALLEAMAAGLPAIATEVGGNAEALQNGAFGRLVPPHDPPALAAEIARMAQDLAMARQKGEAAARHVRRRYAAATMVEGYLALYGDVGR